MPGNKDLWYTNTGDADYKALWDNSSIHIASVYEWKNVIV